MCIRDSNWSSNYTVYLETLEQFDFTDGTSGMLDRSIYDDATEIDPNWFFEMRDPRMKASIFYPGSSFKGGTVHFHRSMSGSGQELDHQNILEVWLPDY